MARIAAIVGRRPGPIDLDDLRFLEDLIASDESLSRLSEEELRRLRGEQLVIAAMEPTRALSTLPSLLGNPKDRRRVLELLERLPQIREELSQEQRSAIDRIKRFLNDKPALSTRDQSLALAT